jgi:hypothetical protein
MTSLQLLLGFLINLIVALLIVRGIYYPTRRNREYMLAFGIGLFALFRMFRYRTDPIPVREMTYMFVLMALPVVDAVLLSESSYLALLVANGTMLLVLYVAEKGWGCRHEGKQSITYDKIDLIKPEHHDRLLADLRERTGLPVTRYEIEHINFLRDVAELQIYYQQGPAHVERKDDLLTKFMATPETGTN